MLRDMITATRSLLKRPGFSAVAIVTLGIGIGASSLIFSVADGVLFRPLPYAAPARLVAASQTNADWLESPNPTLREFADNFPVSYPVYEDWLEMSPVFEEVGVFHDTIFTFVGGDRPERVEGVKATHGVLAALGVQPQLGRLFLPSDDEIGGERLVILSHGLWGTRFGSDPEVLGRPVKMGENFYTVVGVMPREFYFPSRDARFWATLEDETRRSGRDTQSLRALALLRPGVNIEGAQRGMEIVNERIAEANPEHEFGVRISSYKEKVVGNVRPALLLFLGAVGLVLLIACANITNLLLVRATERQREMVVRAALGAGPGRLVGQMVSESLVLSIAGGAAGILVAIAGLKPLIALFPPGIPRADEIGIDYRVLSFAVGLSLFTGLLTGLLPALAAARTQISDALREVGRESAGGRKRTGTEQTLVVAEIALAFVLLISAGLVIKSFANLTSVDRGFVSEGLLTVRLGVPENRYSNDRVQTFYDDLLLRLEALPGVEAAASAAQVPMLGGSSTGTTLVENRAGMQETNVHRSMVTSDYFRTMGIPVKAGRAITEADREGSLRVAVISESMAKEYWPGEDPIGRRLKFGNVESKRPWLDVVGIVGDVRNQQPHVKPRPWVYVPTYQTTAARARTLILKTSIDFASVIPAVRHAVWDLDPQLPIANVATLDDLMDRYVAAPRLRATLLALMATVATVLALVGVYSVIARATALRTREISIRMALGARPVDVVNHVLRRGLRLAVIGLALGLAMSFVSLGMINAFLFEVNPDDPAISILAAALLAAAAIVASYLPARRASRLDPAAALRE